MALMNELKRFRIVDAHIHNWSVLTEPKSVIESLDRFGLEAMVDLSNLEGGHVPSPSRSPPPISPRRGSATQWGRGSSRSAT